MGTYVVILSPDASVTLASMNLRAFETTHFKSSSVRSDTIRNGLIPQAKQISDLKTLPIPESSDCVSRLTPISKSGRERTRATTSDSSKFFASVEGPTELNPSRRVRESTVWNSARETLKATAKILGVPITTRMSYRRRCHVSPGR